MTTRTGLFGWLLACTALVALWSTTRTPAQEKDKPAAAPKWEYKVTTIGGDDQAAEKFLTNLNDEGWELVGMASVVSSKAQNTGSGAIQTTIQVVLKRPKR